VGCLDTCVNARFAVFNSTSAAANAPLYPLVVEEPGGPVALGTVGEHRSRGRRVPRHEGRCGAHDRRTSTTSSASTTRLSGFATLFPATSARAEYIALPCSATRSVPDWRPTDAATHVLWLLSAHKVHSDTRSTQSYQYVPPIGTYSRIIDRLQSGRTKKKNRCQENSRFVDLKSPRAG
jgi:hypothetical protein